MPLNLFYTMVQKSEKWPKNSNQGGSCLNRLEYPLNFYAVFTEDASLLLYYGAKTWKTTKNLNQGVLSKVLGEWAKMDKRTKLVI